MEEFMAQEYIKELILYSLFGGLMGFNIYWIGSAIIDGVKWVIRKIKNKREKYINE